MGVPKFYRWISERYPQINQILSDSSLLPEIDNFYLDMNGIIHACSHPNENDTSKTLTFREMILGIFGYIDRMVTEIVKPKKLLFMAIDGVAPRAKLNQQRSRRFRAAQERQEHIKIAKSKGEVLDEENMFDSNCITPGTEFMEKVGKHLRWFIRKKMKEDPIWQNLEVVFSGHDVPGEGEHKIMQYIRDARATPGYPPNLRHCMYGQDADLIMLGLATHEPHFMLLREIIDFGGGRGSKGGVRQTVIRQTKEAQFQLLHISLLREYIELDLGLGLAEVNFPVDKERLTDDFILMTFFVGNDFLPHLPTLDIGEHAFDVLFDAYKKLMTIDPGYLVENGEICSMDRLERFCEIVGAQEVDILKTREEDERAFNSKRRKYKDANVPTEEELEEAEELAQEAYEHAVQEALGGAPALRGMEGGVDLDDQDLEEDLEEEGIEEGYDIDEDGEVVVVQKPFQVISRSRSQRLKRQQVDSAAANGPLSDAHGNSFVSKDYRGRYYYLKFKVITSSPESSEAFFHKLISSYVEGLVWCLAYYIKGCISWTWYYPYHYGPMLQDMKQLEVKARALHFDLGQPFHPFQQLLGCLPPASKTLLPRSYQWLMSSEHSPVLHFYPEDFAVDMDGKKNPWEAVVLLSFIDEKLLLQAEAEFCKPEVLTLDERARNVFGSVLTHHFDPAVTETVFSCNPEIHLPDIFKCQSRVSFSQPSLSPGAYFRPEIVPGTAGYLPGFPTLGALQMASVETVETKINVFGSESKYKSMVLGLAPPPATQLDPAAVMKVLIGKHVYVNYPQLHEARVVALTSEEATYRGVFAASSGDGNGELLEIVTTRLDAFDAKKWKTEASEMERQYHRGRGIPGSGGLIVGDIQIRLKVVPLQGMRRDMVTGAKKKVFGQVEADVPLQMVLWEPLAVDNRFLETSEVPLPVYMPMGCEVVAVTGPNMGSKGRVVGYSGSASSGSSKASSKDGSRQSLKEEVQASSSSSGKVKDNSRLVDVEFEAFVPEPLFGYALASAVQDRYYASREICRVLNLSPMVLGKIVGSIFIDRLDVGLNLKRNGQYQLLGYARRASESNYTGSIASSVDKSSNSVAKSVWGQGDTVQIVGSGGKLGDEEDRDDSIVQWEYSERTLQLILSYMEKYPALFKNLATHSQRKYTAKDLFSVAGSSGAHGSAQAATRDAEAAAAWIQSEPFSSLPRSPLTTISMSKEAIQAVERAADVRNATLAQATASQPSPAVVYRRMSLDMLYRGDSSSPFETPLSLNSTAVAPRLGDRVVNLNAVGVPFALKGTVVTIHGSTGCVEVVFDEEFVGGRSLQGNCSQFRGRLCRWSSLLRLGPLDAGAAFSATSQSSQAPQQANQPRRQQQQQQQEPRQRQPSHQGQHQNPPRERNQQREAASLTPDRVAPSLEGKKRLNIKSLLPLAEGQGQPAVTPSNTTPNPDAVRILNRSVVADSSTKTPQSAPAPNVPLSMSDGSGRQALAQAAAGQQAISDVPFDGETLGSNLFLSSAAFVPPQPVIVAPSTSSSTTSNFSIPSVPHQQRLPSPTKKRGVSKTKVDTAPAATLPRTEVSVAVDASAVVAAAVDDQKPEVALSTLRKVNLNFSSPPDAPTQAPEKPSPVADAVPVQEATAKIQGLSLTEKLQQAKMSIKSKVAEEKDKGSAAGVAAATVLPSASLTAAVEPPVSVPEAAATASATTGGGIAPAATSAKSSIVPVAVLLRKSTQKM